MLKTTIASIDNATKLNIAQALWMQEYDEEKIPADILEKIHSKLNSNESFAIRFKQRVELMIQNPMSFVEKRDNRYKDILSNIDTLSPQQEYASILFLGPESVTGYEPIPSSPKFNFPQIDSPQLKNQVGWHFYVGNFKDEKGNNYSIQFMFWQYAHLPPDLAEFYGMTDIENQTLEMHLAICDPQKQKQYRATTSVVAGTSGLVSFQPKPYEYKMGKNIIKSFDPDGNLFPLEISAKGFDKSDESNVDVISINLSLTNDKGIFLQGDEGCSPSIGGIGTLYYSASLIKLMKGVTSSISINDTQIELVDGSMWYDHQWGTGFMPNGAPKYAVVRATQNLTTPPPGGWDWFMLQFHENDTISKDGPVQLTISALHTTDNLKFYFQTGDTPPGRMTAKFNGKYIDAHNKTREIKGNMYVSKWVKINYTPDPAVYEPTNTWYPAEYEFDVDNPYIPNALKSFIVTPLIASGQSGFFSMGLEYIEGGAVITNTSGEEIGRGFAEGTNWANCFKGVAKLSGQPVNAKTLSYFVAPEVTELMSDLSTAEVALNADVLGLIIDQAKGI
jgi:predicted secreted hydrolase